MRARLFLVATGRVGLVALSKVARMPMPRRPMPSRRERMLAAARAKEAA